MTDAPRCPWCGDDPLYVDYHDTEWGRPERDDRKLFEMLVLEGAQAGLSWITILRKREGYRAAFHNFDPAKVAAMSDNDAERLMQNPGIVRNRLKIHSAIRNAKVFMRMQREHGSFADWLWAHVDGQPIVRQRDDERVPASTELSDRISKELKKAGMNFVGSTVIYAYLQACGVVNDHLPDCYLHPAG
ncbi:DNA-3-methyladenine glycosylase I [Chromobacterium phragmitis]|uniref:DNA-3-methyladenine glycosylase I n=1 Tax=Chromobacterium phragmitis TaxID=2202141 RepID=A0A344UNF4_9NEIS|nr:DNA-3-methyladenine glycosylase I [Chromobacterium phragmitis]AXE31419.1 DNA-3-methyladenine glycosylase I [Chromobacterium phragmitis]AXE36802.1 DNA-3-methyladenine glycosylase I [Chromobacterium phragmitis]